MGGKSGGNEAGQARAEEQARQAKMRLGTKNINAIFDGGEHYSAVDTKNLVKGQQYYNANGELVTYNGEQSNTPKDGQGLNVDTGYYTKSTRAGQFGDDFFKGRREAYTGYAMPQLQDQYGDAQKELAFALTRGGLLDSSVRGDKAGELQKLYDLEGQNVADKAREYETQARTGVEDARANLIATLNATGDVQGATNSALARSAALSKAPAYNPLGQLFADFTAGLGVKAAQDRAAAYSGGMYRTGGGGGFSINPGRMKIGS